MIIFSTNQFYTVIICNPPIDFSNRKMKTNVFATFVKCVMSHTICVHSSEWLLDTWLSGLPNKGGLLVYLYIIKLALFRIGAGSVFSVSCCFCAFYAAHYRDLSKKYFLDFFALTSFENYPFYVSFVQILYVSYIIFIFIKKNLRYLNNIIIWRRKNWIFVMQTQSIFIAKNLPNNWYYNPGT